MVNATTDENGRALFIMPAQKGNLTLCLFNPVSSDFEFDTVKIFDVLSGGKDYNLYFGSGKYYTVRVFDDMEIRLKPIKRSHLPLTSKNKQ